MEKLYMGPSFAIILLNALSAGENVFKKLFLGICFLVKSLLHLKSEENEKSNWVGYIKPRK